MAKNTIDALSTINSSLVAIARQQYDFQQKVYTYMDSNKGGSKGDAKSETIRIAVSGQGDAVLQAIISGDAGQQNIRNLADGINTLSNNLERFSKMKVVSDTGAMGQISEFVHRLASLNIDDVIALGNAAEKQNQAFSSIAQFLSGLDAIAESTNTISGKMDKAQLASMKGYVNTFTELINDLAKKSSPENVETVRRFSESVKTLISSLTSTASAGNDNYEKIGTFFRNLSSLSQEASRIIKEGGLKDFRKVVEKLDGISQEMKGMENLNISSFESLFQGISTMSETAKNVNPESFENIESAMASISGVSDIVSDMDVERFESDSKKVINALNTVLGVMDGLKDRQVSPDAFKGVTDAFTSLFPVLQDISVKTKRLNVSDMERLGEFLKVLYQVTDEYGTNRNTVQAFDIGPLIRGLDSLTQKDLPKRLKQASSALNGKTGFRLRQFMEELGRMLDSINGKGNDIGAGMQGIVKLLDTISNPRMVMNVRFASAVLTEKAGRSLASFVKALCDGIGTIQNAKEVAEVLKSVGTIMDSIGWMIAKLAIIAMGILLFRPIETLLVMGVLILGVKWLMMSVVKAANKLESSQKAINDLSEAITRLGILMGVLVGVSLLVRIGFGPHPGDFIGIMFGIVFGTIITLAAIVIAGKLISESMSPIRDLTTAVAMLGLFIFSLSLSALIIKEVGWIALLIVPLLILACIGTLAGVFFLLQKMQPSIQEGQIAISELAKGVAMLILLSLGLALMVPFAEYIAKGALLFALTSLVFIGITLLMRKAMGGAQGAEWLKAVAALVLGMLALTLIVTYLLVPLASYWDVALIGMGLLAVMILVASIFAFVLSKTFGGPNGMNAVRGAAVMGLFMFAVSLSLLITVLAAQLAQNMPWDGFMKIGVILVGILGALVIIGLMNRSKLLGNAQIKSVGAIILLMLGLLVVIGLTVLLSQYANQADEGGLYKMAAILGAILASIVVLGLVAKLVESTGAVKNVAILELLMAGLIGIIYLTIITADKAKDVSWEGMGMMGLILVALLGVLTALGVIGYFLLSNPFGALALAGMAVVLGVMGMLVLVLAGFVGVIGKYMEITSQYGDLEGAGTKLGKDFGGFISGVAAGFSGMGFKTMFIMGFLANKLKPLVAACGDFVDVVAKVATLRFADEWDPETGKPTHYAQLDREDFMNAAGMITDGFKNFVSSLHESFGQLGWRAMAAIDYLSDSIGPIMKAVGKFTDAVVKLATGTYQVTDENNPDKTITKHITTDEMVYAAIAVSVGFSEFITELTSSIRSLDGDVEDALEALSENIGPIMTSVGNFTEACIKLATGTYTITGEDGKQITKQLEPGAFGQAAVAIAGNFSQFVKKLLEELKNLDDDAEDAMEELSENIGPIMKAVVDFSNAISKFTDPSKIQLVDHYDERGKPVYSGKTVDVNAAAKNLAKCFTGFVHDIIAEFTKEDIEDNIEDVMELMEKLDPMTKAFSKFAKVVMETTENDAYTKAIEVSMMLSTAMRVAIDTLNGKDNFLFMFGTKNTKDAVTYILDSVISIFKSFGDFEKFGQIDLEKIIAREKDYVRLMKVFMEVDMQKSNNTFHNIIVGLCGDLRMADAKFLTSKKVITDFSTEFDKSMKQIDAALRRNREERRAILQEFSSSMKQVGDQIEYINKAVDLFNSKNFDQLTELAKAMSDSIAMSAANISAQVLVNSGLASGGTTNEGTPIKSQPGGQTVTNNNVSNGALVGGGAQTRNITIELGDTEVVKLRGLLKML